MENVTLSSYHLILENTKTKNYIVLESDTNKDVIESIKNWYTSHNEFFNGTFRIDEINL